MLEKLSKLVAHRGKIHGRGIGSGKGGHTIGRGTKGHKSRSGYQSPRPGFEGGSMPLSRRLPKLKGFSREYYKLRDQKTVVNIAKLDEYKDGETVSLKTLLERGLVKNRVKQVKIVGKENLAKKLNFEGILFSSSAKSTVEKAGGIIK
jgi:large subunit ribosomal protein L15